MNRTKLSIFLILIVFCGLFLHMHFCCAANLEVDYPEIGGYDPNLDSKIQLPRYLKYIFDFGIFAGFFAVFISLIWAGVLYFLAPIQADLKAEAKDKATGAVSGLVILATLYLIITTINPSLKFFKLNSLEPIPEPSAPTQHGVYLYKSNNCSGDPLTLTTSSQDLGQTFNNQIKSINIVNNPKEDIYHVVILYDKNNNRGRCVYMVKTGCQEINYDNFGVVSASVFRYEFSPNGNGVWFYGREGYCKIDNSEINGIFASELSDLYLTSLSDCADDTLRCGDRRSECTTHGENCVCKQWVEDGSCEGEKIEERYCPNLAGENISGIKLDGNYVAVLVYYGPQDLEKTGPWTDCQAYPVPDDVDKTGGIIKWDAIRNNNYGRLPNWMFILPVKQK
jgi:hypothetical protein